MIRRFVATLLAALIAWAPTSSQAVLKSIGVAPLATNTQIAAPYILYKGGIPLISLATGTMTAGGAMTVGTALPTTYPNAYCYFPANTVAASIAAGFYYCTFTTTTAGTAFQNPLPATGVATIPTSPTAVTAGSNWTGDTGEEFGITINVGAGAMGANGAIRIDTECLQTNNANVKTQRVRFSGNGGTVFFSSALASLGAAGFSGHIANASAAVQTGSVLYANTTGTSITAGVGGTVNTANATTLVFSLQKATATDNIVLYPPIVQLLSDGT